MQFDHVFSKEYLHYRINLWSFTLKNEVNSEVWTSGVNVVKISQLLKCFLELLGWVDAKS